MALGNGCPFKARCKQCARETSYFKNDYCNNDLNWKKCAYTPGNAGNKQAQQDMENYKKSQGNASLIVLVIIGIAIYALWKHFT